MWHCFDNFQFDVAVSLNYSAAGRNVRDGKEDYNFNQMFVNQGSSPKCEKKESQTEN